MNLLYYAAAFALALGLLIVVHEMGHFLVARACGVKVLRFSVGFGRPLLLKRFRKDGTEWAVSIFPLGGYVKMLDEREGEVRPEELHRAFNRQPVWKRFLIVSAGPLANLLLAIALYWGLFLHGVEEPKPLLGAPQAESVAASAGFGPGELVRKVGDKSVATWQEFRWEVLRQAMGNGVVDLEVINLEGQVLIHRLDLSRVSPNDLDDDFLRRLGFRPYRPKFPPVVGSVLKGSPADEVGLRSGDRINEIDGKPVGNWQEVVAAVRGSPGQTLKLGIQRGSEYLVVSVVPTRASENGKPVGRIGVGVHERPEDRSLLMASVRYGLGESLDKAVRQTWDTATFSLSSLGRMITGELSWRNLSGPVTIADYAGQSARLGIAHYIKFLALISISLGVLNLLPIPLLDGGHLMYYMIEVIKGGPVSERWMEIGQQVGLAILAMLMAFAFYNDINRLISS